ncbi:hypothetical protein N646_3678 [Vibrio alginolyticus NBRC 15630 = ATCC 17749]|uniref:Uncharacterized protein n=1 Tax=Vibrio alginolyticus (strain ATCC 17749 / DSM 2171 / NBRC 15630 / NCIMB 1903 / NCTC 12160 / XII-53) TaxID=1219076 RepID=A0A2I3CND7_VIBAX|nr:hypothetical protein N646_3678 [Vibrio alginolyticus NBRC 15630 = ATCC 17749]
MFLSKAKIFTLSVQHFLSLSVRFSCSLIVIIVCKVFAEMDVTH